MKVLITRFSSIGDIILTSPVLRCLQEQRPDVEVHFLTRTFFRELLSANPYIHKIHTFRDNLQEVIKDLRAEKFDYIIDLHKNLRSYKLKALLRRPALTFDKLNLRKFFYIHFKIGSLPKVHIVDRYLKPLRVLGVQNDGKGLDHFIPEDQEVDTSTFPHEFQQGYVVWVIGAKHFTKRFPDHKVREVIREIPQPVVLLGGSEDRDHGTWIAGEFYHVLNKCGDYTLNQAASVIQQSQKVISNDTGLMHMAAALKKPVVSLWGNTVPEFGMYPYYSANEEVNQAYASIVQVEGLYCRPCSKLGFFKCPEGHFRCMREINNESVAHEVREGTSVKPPVSSSASHPGNS